MTQRNASQMPRLRSAFERLQRVVVVLALVVDAAHARPQHEVLVRQDLVPEGLDLFDLREEAVAADVEAPAVALDGAADAADDGVGLEDRRRDAVAGDQLVGRGQPGRPGADDDDVGFRRGGIGGFAHETLSVGRRHAARRDTVVVPSRPAGYPGIGRGRFPLQRAARA